MNLPNCSSVLFLLESSEQTLFDGGRGKKKEGKKKRKKELQLQVGNTQQCRSFCQHFPSFPWLDVDLGVGFWGFGSLHWALGSVTLVRQVRNSPSVNQSHWRGLRSMETTTSHETLGIRDLWWNVYVFHKDINIWRTAKDTAWPGQTGSIYLISWPQLQRLFLGSSPSSPQPRAQEGSLLCSVLPKLFVVLHREPRLAAGKDRGEKGWGENCFQVGPQTVSHSQAGLLQAELSTLSCLHTAQTELQSGWESLFCVGMGMWGFAFPAGSISHPVHQEAVWILVQVGGKGWGIHPCQKHTGVLALGDFGASGLIHSTATPQSGSFAFFSVYLEIKSRRSCRRTGAQPVLRQQEAFPRAGLFLATLSQLLITSLMLWITLWSGVCLQLLFL